MYSLILTLSNRPVHELVNTLRLLKVFGFFDIVLCEILDLDVQAIEKFVAFATIKKLIRFWIRKKILSKC